MDDNAFKRAPLKVLPDLAKRPWGKAEKQTGSWPVGHLHEPPLAEQLAEISIKPRRVYPTEYNWRIEQGGVAISSINAKYLPFKAGGSFDQWR